MRAPVYMANVIYGADDSALVSPDEIAGALCPLGLGFGPAQGRQEQRRQNMGAANLPR